MNTKVSNKRITEKETVEKETNEQKSNKKRKICELYICTYTPSVLSSCQIVKGEKKMKPKGSVLCVTSETSTSKGENGKNNTQDT